MLQEALLAFVRLHFPAAAEELALKSRLQLRAILHLKGYPGDQYVTLCSCSEARTASDRYESFTSGCAVEPFAAASCSQSRASFAA
jgi:hypothetical protein